MEKIIKKLVQQRDSSAAHVARQTELRRYVKCYGIEYVMLATGLKASTLNQYLRGKHPRISMETMDAVRYVFNSNEFKPR